MEDILGSALYEYHFHRSKARLWIHNKYGPKEEMPVRVYFRNKQKMPELELVALAACKGKILDIGAGAGNHALILQQMGLDVTALELSPKAVEVMKDRGVVKLVMEDIFSYNANSFDTLLLLMNGIGLCGTLEKLKIFLQQAKKLLNKNGQLLFDSSDVAYLYGKSFSKPSDYYGEISYQYEYKGVQGDWFEWLYVDEKTLKRIAEAEGYRSELLFKDEYDQYLVRLSLK